MQNQGDAIGDSNTQAQMRDVYGGIHIYPPGVESNVDSEEIDPDLEDSDFEEDDSSTSGCGVIGVIVFVVLIIAANFMFDGSGSNEDVDPFHEPGDTKPADYDEQVVLAPVLNKINSCVRVRYLRPRTCPQVVKGLSEDSVKELEWKLEGDPLDGVRVSFHAGLFDVIGHAVMSVKYIDPYQNKVFQVKKISYRAKVDWNGGAAILVGGLHPAEVEPKKNPVKKISPSEESLGKVEPVLRDFFYDCIKSKVAPMPQGCLQGPHESFYKRNNVSWSLDGDPLENHEISFDDSWGLIHVRANYGLTMRYQDFLLGSQSQRAAGIYNATLLPSIDGVSVLQITEE